MLYEPDEVKKSSSPAAHANASVKAARGATRASCQSVATRRAPTQHASVRKRASKPACESRRGEGARVGGVGWQARASCK
eukprot:608334-Prymnesium_polylepis.1